MCCDMVERGFLQKAPLEIMCNENNVYSVSEPKISFSIASAKVAISVIA